MQISIGLGNFLTPRRLRMARRGTALAGVVWGGLTFLTFDLVRNDAHFSVGAWFPEATELQVDLFNQASVPMQNTNISFRFYDADGSIVLHDANEDGNHTDEDLAEHRFQPDDMTIAPTNSKFAIFYADQLERSFDDIRYIKFCAIHDGSFWVDKVKAVYLLARSRGGTFGQVQYKKDVFFFSEPECNLTKEIDPV